MELCIDHHLQMCRGQRVIELFTLENIKFKQKQRRIGNNVVVQKKLGSGVHTIYKEDGKKAPGIIMDLLNVALLMIRSTSVLYVNDVHRWIEV